MHFGVESAEEKEAKRLFSNGGRAFCRRRNRLGARTRRAAPKKVFFASFFFRKKKNPFPYFASATRSFNLSAKCR
jgi:hypothetical protein